MFTVVAPIIATLLFDVKIGLIFVFISYTLGMIIFKQITDLTLDQGLIRSIIPLLGNAIVCLGADRLHKYFLYKIQTEKALIQSEKKYRMIFEKSADGIICLDSIGKIIDASQSIVTHLQTEPAAIVGDKLSAIRGFPLSAAIEIESLIAIGKPVSDIEFLAEDVDSKGEKAFFEIVFSCLGRDHDDFCGICVVKNNTEKHILTEKLHHQQKMEAIGRLAGGVAHDMNNTFAAIQSSIYAIIKDTNGGGESSDDLDRVLEACSRGVELTRNLLGFARKGTYKRERFDLDEVVLRLRDILIRTASKNIRIETEIEPNMPAIVGNMAQIESAIMNVCMNALDAMPKGGILFIKLRALENGVSIVVTDTGEGIDKETLAHVFEPFFTTKPLGRGTGLGLSLAWSVIQNHGGAINIESEPEKGTSVTIIFPFSELQLEDKSPSRSSTATAAWVELPDSPMILLVDDEPLILRSGQRLLETMGCRTVLAEGGRKAIEIYSKQQNDISLVILDLMMPEMDGSATLQKLLMINPNVKVLLSSGYSGETNIVETLLKEGAAGFIAKPYEPKDMCRSIGKILDIPSSLTRQP